MRKKTNVKKVAPKAQRKTSKKVKPQKLSKSWGNLKDTKGFVAKVRETEKVLTEGSVASETHNLDRGAVASDDLIAEFRDRYSKLWREVGDVFIEEVQANQDATKVPGLEIPRDAAKSSTVDSTAGKVLGYDGTSVSLGQYDFKGASKIPEDVISLVPPEVAYRYGMVPIGKTKDTLILATNNPTDVYGLDDIAFLSGYKVTVVDCPKPVVVELLERYYKAPNRVELGPESENPLDDEETSDQGKEALREVLEKANSTTGEIKELEKLWVGSSASWTEDDTNDLKERHASCYGEEVAPEFVAEVQSAPEEESGGKPEVTLPGEKEKSEWEELQEVLEIVKSRDAEALTEKQKMLFLSHIWLDEQDSPVRQGLLEGTFHQSGINRYVPGSESHMKHHPYATKTFAHNQSALERDVFIRQVSYFIALAILRLSPKGTRSVVTKTLGDGVVNFFDYLRREYSKGGGKRSPTSLPMSLSQVIKEDGTQKGIQVMLGYMFHALDDRIGKGRVDRIVGRLLMDAIAFRKGEGFVKGMTTAKGRKWWAKKIAKDIRTQVSPNARNAKRLWKWVSSAPQMLSKHIQSVVTEGYDGVVVVGTLGKPITSTVVKDHNVKEGDEVVFQV